MTAVNTLLFNEIRSIKSNKKRLLQFGITSSDDIESITVVAIVKTKEKITFAAHLESSFGMDLLFLGNDRIMRLLNKFFADEYTSILDSQNNSLTILNKEWEEFYIDDKQALKYNDLTVAYGISERTLRTIKKKCCKTLYSVVTMESDEKDKLPSKVDSKNSAKTSEPSKILVDSDVLWSKKNIPDGFRDEYGFEIRKNLGFREE